MHLARSSSFSGRVGEAATDVDFDQWLQDAADEVTIVSVMIVFFCLALLSGHQFPAEAGGAWSCSERVQEAPTSEIHMPTFHVAFFPRCAQGIQVST